MKGENGGGRGPGRKPREAFEAGTLAASLHSSLALGEIVAAAASALAELVSTCRVTLALYRGNDQAVSLHAAGTGEGSPGLRTYVAALRPSRLKDAMALRQAVEVRFATPAEMDSMECEHLLGGAEAAACYTPLQLGDAFKGVLVVGLEQAEVTGEQAEWLGFIAREMAVAVENSDRFYMERRRARQLSMIGEVAKAAVRMEDHGEFLTAACRMLREGFGYDRVEIWTEREGMEPLALKAWAAAAHPASGTRTGNLPDAVRDCMRACSPVCVESGSGGSVLSVPVRMAGKTLGALYLESGRPDAFPAEDLVVMEGAASLVASAFANLRTLEQARQSREYLQSILASARGLGILSTDLNGYVTTCNPGCRPIFGVEAEQMLGRDILPFFSNTQFQAELAVFLGSPSVPKLERDRLPQAGQGREIFIDVTFSRFQDANHRTIGYIAVVRDVTETVTLQRRLEALSITDDLTGLLNQRRFFAVLSNEIERHQRFTRKFCLAFLDLDGFKQYNDTMGHLAGDQALRDAAGLLKTAVRSGVDVCFRYGGDEFVVLMPETPLSNAAVVADRIRARIHEYFQGAITVSIGIAEWLPGLSGQGLVARADAAMYASKTGGGNRITLAEPDSEDGP